MNKKIEVCADCEGMGEVYPDFDREADTGGEPETCGSCNGDGNVCANCGLPESECECDSV